MANPPKNPTTESVKAPDTVLQPRNEAENAKPAAAMDAPPPLGAPVQPPPVAPPQGIGAVAVPPALVGGPTVEDPTTPGANYRGNDVSNPANVAQAKAMAEANDDRTSRQLVEQGDGDTIVVRSKSDRFRRAGMAFNRQWQKIDPRDLTPNQLDALLDEPSIEVRRVSNRQADALTGIVDAGTIAEYESAPRAQLLAELSVTRTERDQYKAQCEELTRKLAGDRAPKGDSKELASDRSTSPLPNPDRKSSSSR